MNENEKKGFDVIYERVPFFRDKIHFKKFSKTVNKVVKESSEDYEHIDLNFIPDGYLIDLENKIIFIFEIENYNQISKEKMYKLVNAWFDLDYYYWNLALVIVDRYGEIAEPPLHKKYLELLKEQVA